MPAASDHPRLACPACGYSLRGIEPLGPAQALRCPECGGVTSIGVLAAQHARRRSAQHRLVKMLAIIAAAIGLFAFFRPDPEHFAVPGARALGLFLGLTITALLSLVWQNPPWLMRSAFIAGGGLVLMFTIDRFVPLPILAWWLGWHIWAMRRGYA